MPPLDLSSFLLSWIPQWASHRPLAVAAQQWLGILSDETDWSELLQQWQEGNLTISPAIELASSEELQGARGAYDRTNNRILLNWDWSQQANNEQLQTVFAEELGHWLNARFNKSTIGGDEGRLFAAALLEEELSSTELESAQSENDTRLAVIGGQSVVLEQNRVYETRWSSSSVNEDGTITLEVYLTTAPAFDVTVTVSAGETWRSANGETAGSTELTFTPSDVGNGENKKTVTLLPRDDHVQDGDRVQTIGLTFSSADTSFDGLSETLSVNVIDNDFQRSLETTKRPSGGNNHIIYDFTGTSADYTFTNNGTGYDLAAGNDKLEITGSYQSSLKNTWFSGNTGNDSISGATIADGGSGDDTLVTFSTGVTNKIYRDGDNRNSSGYVSKVYVGEWTTTRLAGNTGNDSISAGNISLVAAGGSGSDSISGSTSNDILWGDGYESLNISPNYQADWWGGNQFSPDTSWGNAANNYFKNWFSTDVSLANGGNDSINAGVGNDWVDGGGGHDTLIGGIGHDTLIGSTGNDSIDGGDGNDSIDGGFGADTISGGAGNDNISSGDGKDLINAGDGNNTIDAGGDNDTITSGTGNDNINAGDGDDSITSGLGDDSINAGDGADTVNAGIGNDTISGGLGNDALYGNENNDSISGNEGNDSLYGGDGSDTLYGGSGDDRLEAGSGSTNTLYGEAGNDTLIGSDGNDLADGGVNDDLISGAAGNDTLLGADGNDTLSGGSGSDSLSGGSGTDSLAGGDGSDTLSGGLGADILSGGSGSDTFRYTAENLADLPDTITDFAAGSGGDIVDLAALHTASLASAGDLWSGSEFTYTHGYIQFSQSGTDTLVQYDRDGLNGTYGSTTVATLSGVDATTVLPGINSNPALSNKLFLLEQEQLSPGLAEDSGASIIYRAVLGKAPTANVTLDITGGDQITVNGAADSTSLTFSADNWWVPQDITVAAADDLLIEGNVPATIEHTFSSADTSFDGLSETLSVNVIDNDFQRSLETTKRPSGGNNHIIYDFTGTSADYTFTNNGTGYDLAAGNDKLEITGSYQSSLKNTWFSGNTGNDSISGATIADGGSGDDTLVTFSTGVTNKIYRDGDNRNSSGYVSKVYVGEWTTTRLAGNTGNDSISAGNISLVAAGGSGSDSISGSTSNDILWGDGYESLNISPNYQADWWGGNQFSPDTSWGNAANNYFKNWFSTDVSLANGGNDSINAGVGNDWVDGGGGHDTLIGGIGHDTLIGSTGNDSIDGGDGNDSIDGGFGADTISGGAGNDNISSGDGKDLINAGDGNNTIDAGGDNDTITSGTGNDNINAGDGDDSITSGLGDDSINAGDGADTVNAGIGNDTISGGLGNDALYGNENNDSISGNEGNDSLYGGDGSDTLYGGSGDDRLEAGSGSTNTLYGEAGNDTLIGSDGNDLADGGVNDDLISGAAGNDTLLGADGNDTLSGGSGSDSLSGGSGTDSLAGGDGSDTLSGGLGADILSGGSGSDTFRYTAENLADLPDTITDFAAGSGGDIVDLAALHTASLASAGDLWSGSEFTYTHGYIQFSQSGTDTLVQYDRDGLNGTYGSTTVATLSGVDATTVLPGINSNPALSNKLFLLEQEQLSPGLAEDSGASIIYRAVLGKAPTANVTLDITGGDQITVNGAADSTSLTFSADNWWVPQDITVAAADDLLIEGNVPATIEHTFSSADTSFDGLSETLSVNVIDNDFQRSLETTKRPSGGNNHIIYDFTGTSADYTFTNNGTGYDLAAGNDKLEITGSYQSSLKNTWFSGNTGNDSISGATIADGGSGDDTLVTFSTGVTNKIYRDGDNRNSSGYVSKVYVGEWTTTRLAGNTGNDSISAGNISLVAAGGSGSDSISGSTSNDILWGDGYESLNISPNYQADWWGGNQFSPDTSWGNAANNYFKNWFSTDVSLANGGNDSINAGVGNDWVDGGGGHDTLIGGIGHDTLIGSTGNDSIDGGDGNDSIDGGFGADTISGGAGNDNISSGDGKDLINAGDGNNTIDAGGDNDTITSGTGNDNINAGDGDDSITSGLGDDSINAGDGADTVNAGIGNDTISGGLGNDALYGNENNDSISGNEGNDSLYGGDGSDTLYGGSGDDRLEAGSGSTNTLYGEAGNDTLIGSDGNDLADGGVNDDLISGAAGNDTLLGADGNDTLSGGSGSDSLSGGSGTDSLAGGDGSDTLSGGLGADILSGGSGSDTFRYTAENLADLPDTITDFAAGSGGDIVDLAALHTASLASAGDLWSGSEFTYTHGYIQFSQSGTDTLVQYDRDGLNGTYGSTTVATLSGVDATTVLPGINSNPALSNKLFLLEQEQLSPGLAEDSGASIIYRAVLGKAPTANVTLDITGGDQITVNGAADSTSLTFSADNWWVPQDITVAAADDLLIEGNVPATIEHTFSSADTSFDGLSETLSVNVIDNDFQRSLETTKRPSGGNNHIIYDFTGTSADYTFTNNGTGYDLAAGNDKLEITGSYQSSLKNTWFSGNTGNDSISGATIADGGSGDDTLVTFSTGVTNKIYRDGDNRNSSGYVSKVYVGEWTTTRLAGNTGNDSISAGNISLVAAGGSGSDSISGSTSNDILWGDGYESLNISPNYQADWWGGNQFSPDTSWGNAANNYFKNWFSTDVSLANGGNDSINAGVGNDWVDGGGGHDTLIGGIGHDTLIGSTGNDSIDGGDGNDSIDGGFGADTISGGAGNDNISSGDGKDLINAGDGNNTIDAGGDNDTITSGTGNDNINAGDGDDSITSGLGDDSINAGDGADTVNAGIGNDTISGGLGNDALYGNENNDSISGNEGNDSLYGGDGSDTLYGGSGDDRLEAGSGSTNTLYGEAGNDTLIGSDGNDLADGGVNDDLISGAAGNDTLLGADGNDTLSGGSGSDSLSGGSGTDSLAGGDGSDTLSGGLGADILSGGSGSDTFRYTAENLADLPDTITDFAAGSGGDIVDLAALHTASLASAGDLWSGSEFTYTHGYIQFSQSGTDTLVQYDRDGLNGTYGSTTVATLSGVDATTVLPGINSNPALSNKLFLLEQEQLSPGLAEDSGASIIYRAVLGKAPTANVTLDITGGDQITVNGAADSTSLTFSADNWWVPQDITVAAADDLLIEGNVPATIEHTFSSADTSFDGLSETLSVNVIDNDFQRSLETTKRPSGGNNHIIYDFTGTSADYTFTNNGTGYDLAAGNDKLEITGSYQSSLKNTWFSGNTGNDSISGATIADGGSGDDTLVTFSTGVTNKIYRDGDNRNSSGYVSKVYVGEWTTTRLAGNTGNDSISAGNISLVAAGGSGSDSISGSTSNDILWGDGYESLNISPNYQADWWGGNQFSPDTSWGNAANNYFKNWFSTDVSLANGGNDSINAGVGNDWVDGGGGHDTLIGGIGHDTLIGSTGNDSIDGGDGNDSIDGGFGADTISGGAGNDNISSGDGKDLINAGDGNNTIDAGGDNDTITSGTGNDNINAGDGDDSITSGLGDDSINAGDGADTVNAGIGNDTISGGLGNDALYGNENNDSISGNEGNDSLYGGDGSDTLYGGSGDDRLEAGSGSTNTLYGEAGNDTLIGSDGNDLADGGVNDDLISGAAGNDTLLGADGNDTLSGGSGSDSLSGGSGTDSLAGGDGSDTLSGGLGADILSGGSGSDTFRYTAENLADLPDTITDFAAGSGGDIVDLAALHTASLASAGDLWSGSEFTYTHGYIQFSQSGTDTLVQYDRDGLNGTYGSTTVATLSGVDATTVLPGINSNPALSNKLFLLEQEQLSPGLAEDSGASIIYRAVLGKAPTANVTLDITGGDQITVNGAADSTSLTFSADNWWVPQDITVAAADDLLIEGNVPATIEHTFSSADTSFDGLSETLSVNVIDNDFQRSLETTKRPSGGNNHIIYDFTGTSADYTFTNNGTGYDLAAGNDKLEITGSYQSSLKNTWFSGNTGNDSISGATIADGGSGDDTLVTFSTGVTNKIYRDGDNRNSSGYVSKVYVGEWTTTRLAGNTGNDSISAGNISLVAAGGSGSDSISGSTSNDILWGDGYESLNISPNYQADWWGGNQFSPDTSWGNAANNYFKNWFSTDVSLANGGNDSINAGVGNDWVDGGGGHDTLIGGIGHDTLIGSTGNDSIDGGDGNDSIDGGFGADTISGGAGNDNISSGDGKDLINAGDGNNTIDAGGDNDTITSGTGNDNINAGDGDDSITSGLGDDSINAGDGADTVNAGIGNDTISGGLGNDALYGNENNDSISGNEGNDSLYGGDGSDTLYGGSGDDRLEAGSGSTNTLYGEAGNDTLIGSDGNDLADGGVNDDLISGAAGNDTLLGADGNDTLSGGSGSDSLSGGSGTDSLAGGDGSDTLSGGLGADILSGGSGSDTFRYTAENLADLPDTITDFAAGSGGDKLDLNELHASNSLINFPDDNYPFSLGYLRLIKSGPDTLVAYDKDGFSPTHQAQTVGRLANVDALKLTPENFVAGEAATNYGFQRNGAIVAIDNSSDNSELNYKVRLWGGTPSETVSVRLTNKQSTEVGVLTFNSENWDQSQTLSISRATDTPIAPIDLSELNIAIISDDINYQGSGLSLGIVNSELTAQRLPLTQINLPAFNPEEEIREIRLSSTSDLSNQPLPSSLRLTPIQGDGAAVIATPTVVDKHTLKLTLNPDASKDAWEGETTFIAEPATKNESTEAFGFRVTLNQAKSYILNTTALQTTSPEGSETEPTTMQVKVSVNSPALSDLKIGWSVSGAGSHQATADDFIESILPSGIATITKGTNETVIEVKIEADLIQEQNEDFKIIFTNQSDSEIDTTSAEKTLTIANDDLSKLSGTVSYWKNNTPLNSLNLNIAKSQINASADDSIQFRNIIHNKHTGRLTAELWAASARTDENDDHINPNPIDETENSKFYNANFSFNKDNDANFEINLNRELFDENWLTSINETSDSYEFSAISLAGHTKGIKIADLSASIPSSTSTPSAYLEHGQLGDATAQTTRFEAIKQLDLINGQFEHDTLTGSFTAEIHKDPLIGHERRAIDSRDALMALRMSSGSISNSNLSSQLQWVAADVDQNGQVQAKDAWLINQYIVNDEPTGSNAGSWEFFDSNASLETLGPSNSILPLGAGIEEIKVPTGQETVSITALIYGDVNGSHAGT